MTDTIALTILGCGSSGGVPRIGGPDGAGDWGACDPANPKNRRRRCSVLVKRKARGHETAVLVDTAPDLREQMIDAHCARLDAVLLTHDHADQLHGLDDLRAVVLHMRRRLDVHADGVTLAGVRRRFGYVFEQPEGSDYPPILNAREIAEPFAPFDLHGPGGALPVLAFAQEHGRVRSLGFRFGPIAYSSDVNGLSDDAFAALDGVKVWIVDALRYAHHPTHANVATALAWIARMRPERAILTNLHLDLDFERLKGELPPGVEPAYDGLTVEVPI